MSDPKRLADLGSDAPDGLRTLLRSGREDLPSSARLERVAASLAPLLGGPALPHVPQTPPPAPPPVAPAAGSAAAGAAGAGALVKLIGATTVVAVLAGGGWLVTREPPKPAISPAPVEQPQAPVTNAPPPAPQPTSEASEAPSEPAEPAPHAEAPARSQASGPSESALLAQAQAALSTNPARALALTREHKRRFPNGALAQEREVIAIEALKRGGDADAARKRAKEFEDRYPGSAHRRKVENETKP